MIQKVLGLLTIALSLPTLVAEAHPCPLLIGEFHYADKSTKVLHKIAFTSRLFEGDQGALYRIKDSKFEVPADFYSANTGLDFSEQEIIPLRIEGKTYSPAVQCLEGHTIIIEQQVAYHLHTVADIRYVERQEGTMEQGFFVAKSKETYREANPPVVHTQADQMQDDEQDEEQENEGNALPERLADHFISYKDDKGRAHYLCKVCHKLAPNAMMSLESVKGARGQIRSLKGADSHLYELHANEYDRSKSLVSRARPTQAVSAKSNQ